MNIHANRKFSSIPLFLVVVLYCLNLSAAFEFETSEDVYVIGDVHGAYDNLVTTLRQQGIIDEYEQWIAGKAHLVSLGDLLDRGADSRKVLDLFRKVQSEAKKAGGMVHIVLGNHEVMNLTGDLRYVSDAEFLAFYKGDAEKLRKKSYRKFLKVYKQKNNKKSKKLFNKTFPKGFFAYIEAFSPQGEYGRWILSLPFVVKINDQIFAHAGLSERVRGLSLKDLNETLKTSLEQYLSSWEKILKKQKKLFYPSYKQRFEIVEDLREESVTRQFLRTRDSLLLSQFGPTWYRGNALCHPFYETENLTQTLNEFNASRLWVGHTTTFNHQPHQRLNGQLLNMDTGMLNEYYGGQPVIAKIKNNGTFELFNGLSEEKIAAYSSPSVENINLFNLPDLKVEKVLRKAKVIAQSGDSKDFNQGQRLTLDYDGHQFMARFFTMDKAPGSHLGDWNSDNASARRYQYEIAAYKIDRMLNIGLVPVTIERSINGKKGALQFLLEDALSASEVSSRYGGQLGVCSKKDQENMKDVFGYLIQNSSGRRMESYFTADNGYILFLNNSHSFNPSTQFTAKFRPEEIYVSAAFKTALLSLKDQDLAGLASWIHPKQIEAIKLRIDRLIGD